MFLIWRAHFVIQASNWVRNKETENGLKVVKQTDADFLQMLESCIRNGTPVLCEDLGESLNPALELVLLSQAVQSVGALCMLSSGETVKIVSPPFAKEMYFKRKEFAPFVANLSF